MGSTLLRAARRLGVHTSFILYSTPPTPVVTGSDVFWKSRRDAKQDKQGDKCMPFVISLFVNIHPHAVPVSSVTMAPPLALADTSRPPLASSSWHRRGLIGQAVTAFKLSNPNRIVRVYEPASLRVDHDHDDACTRRDSDSETR